MLQNLARKIFGTTNDKIIKEFNQNVLIINSLESEISNLTKEEIQNRTNDLKEQVKNGKSLDEILNEAFALCREAGKRALNMRHFDSQLIGGIALHRGMIAEMHTGEGKTLVCTLAAYLNALSGKSVHVVTVNDYLARRDSEWMGQLFNYLGLTVGCIVSDISDLERKQAYKCDILYGTNNEFGFDYLRDNLKLAIEDIAQNNHNFAIIDEVDSILIDEARTPLIISGPSDKSSNLYVTVDHIVKKLENKDYEIDEKGKVIQLSDHGNDIVEKILKEQNLIDEDSSLYDISNIDYVHHVNQSLRAHHLFKADVDYLIKDQKIIIIDEFTGRMMPGRRFSDGLHQALEAKERVQIQNENQTLASITFQNYFRNYKKLAGMTGTAMTEADEFIATYGLEVVSIPTHKTQIRNDHDDEIYRSQTEKLRAIIKQIKECNAKQQPILVGTVSIEKSELISSILKKEKINHNVLNAKNHDKEAHIIAQAGRPGSVTIATNMAGRGTDIMLGGNPEMLISDSNLDSESAFKQVSQDKDIVKKAGGLFVIGSERHESRRIDNQLRGRSGRQGDPGETKFFLSLEDDLMRLFGSDKVKGLLHKMGFKEDEVLHHPFISKALERAQKKVEGHNFDIRKTLIKFDDVLNEQRKIIYKKRIELLERENYDDIITEFRNDLNEMIVVNHIPEKTYIENWDLKGLSAKLNEIYGNDFNIAEYAKKDGITEIEILEEIDRNSEKIINTKQSSYDEKTIHYLNKTILLMTIDNLWREHINLMDSIKTSINLRAYGQKDPLTEYKHEAFKLFENLLNNYIETTIKNLTHVKISESSQEELQKEKFLKDHKANKTLETHQSNLNSKSANQNEPNIKKVGRNEKCPCESGKKYKHCCGKL
ncbi:MAG: preprotein translocase subunit SecA [Rickettsiales bacterium]|nr:preprotein translocase subunit SecA [Rickettsiales bacterium]